MWDRLGYGKVIAALALMAVMVMVLSSCITIQMPSGDTGGNDDKAATQNMLDEEVGNLDDEGGDPGDYDDGTGDGLDGGTAPDVTGTQQQGGQQVNQQVSGSYYNRYELVDQTIGVPVFNAFLPQGWTANISSNWNVISIGAPGLEEITINSPDGRAQITIDSCQCFVQSPYHDRGSNFEYYTTYLDYLNAGQFVDMYMDQTHPGYKILEESPVDEETIGWLNQYNDTMVAKANGTSGAITIGSTSSVQEPYATSMCKRKYNVNGQIMEASCVDTAMTQTITGPVLTEQYIHWRIPYSIVYLAADEQAFQEYYDEYSMIIGNSQFTPQYYAAEDYVASQITAVAMDAKAAACSDATSSFSSSGYESSTGDSTNEKVIEMWDDYINEVDSYTTLDGGTVKTSMYNDIVAQSDSGDEFFVGSSTSDIPSGFTELSKSY